MSAVSITFQRKRALIVGINEYSSNELRYCVKDAEDFAKSLGSIGFEINLSLNCDFTEFRAAFQLFLNENKSTDLILIYFAGHAKVYNTQNYLLLANYSFDLSKVESKAIKDGAIPVDYIVDKASKIATTILIIDCCRKYLNVQEHNAKQNLLPMRATSKILIAYAKCPVAVPRNESINKRNGSVMEILLQYIAKPGLQITDIITHVSDDLYRQTSNLKFLQYNREFKGKIYPGNASNQDRIQRPPDAIPSNVTPRDIGQADHHQRRAPEQSTGTDLRDKNSSAQSSMQPGSQRLGAPISSVSSVENEEKLEASFHGVHHKDQAASQSSSSHLTLSDHRRASSSYQSEIFGVNPSTTADLKNLFEYLRYGLPAMTKLGPMSGKCIPQTDQMEAFLKQNFGFRNTDQYIVSGVRSFEIRRSPSDMNPNSVIQFPNDHPNPFLMAIFEIKKWQSSYMVYADRNIPGMDKAFLKRALQGQSRDGSEAFRMKFVVRISDCPIMMNFNAKILSRSLRDSWPHLIKLVSVTGVDFAGRKHDVNDVTTYIKNWKQVFIIDPNTGTPEVFHGRDFYPVEQQPPAILDKDRLLDHLIRMVRLRLNACDREGVQIVVETGIGLGVFAGKHIGIDAQVRQSSAYAIRSVLEKDSMKYNHIRAIVFALPIFVKTRDGREGRDTYHDFVDEFRTAPYSGCLPVLIADQDMHELTVAIALKNFRVSQLNPADSHGVFGEYWQNHGPAVEEKLALTTAGLLVQHHLINPFVLDENRYNIV